MSEIEKYAQNVVDGVRVRHHWCDKYEMCALYIY